MKLSAYECGNDPVRLPRGERFSVKFYVVAMLFIIFDIEIIFLFPWAVRVPPARAVRAREMAVFIAPRVRRVRLRLAQAGGLDWAETVETPLETTPQTDLMAEADAELAAAMRDPEAAGAR